MADEYAEAHLFNGEYFYQEHDPTYPDSTGTFYSLRVQPACRTELGYQVGIGSVVHPKKANTSLNTSGGTTSPRTSPIHRNIRHRPSFRVAGRGRLMAAPIRMGTTTHNVAYLNECQAGL